MKIIKYKLLCRNMWSYCLLFFFFSPNRSALCQSFQVFPEKMSTRSGKSRKSVNWFSHDADKNVNFASPLAIFYVKIANQLAFFTKMSPHDVCSTHFRPICFSAMWSTSLVLFQHFLPLTEGRVPYQTSFVAQIRPVFKFFVFCLQNPRDALISK